MKISSQNMIWIDLEMTGLDPDTDKILEIAVVITDKNVDEVVEGPVIAIHHCDSILEKMDEWNVSHHSKSGLIERVKSSHIGTAEAETMIIEFLQQYVPSGKSPICGNTICQDRRFLYRYMPALEKYFHYRNFDVSVLKVIAKRWYPDIAKQFKKKTKHQALSDIYDSIEEFKFYRDNLLLPVGSK